MELTKNLILIIAEDDSFRSDVSIAFQKKGWIVLVTHKGQQSLDNMEKYLPDVVLMDIELPDANGIAVCKTVKNDTKITRQFPIILMGTTPNKAKIIQAIEARCDDFILKPLKFFTLFSKIEKLVEFYHKKLIQVKEEGIDLQEVTDDEDHEIIIYAKKVLESAYSNTMNDKIISYPIIKNVINKMIEEFNKEMSIPLAYKLGSYHDYTYIHSINVTSLSLSLAYNLKWDRADLEIIGVGAFLHDIGKSKIDLQVLLKPDKLTDKEFSEIKKHALYSKEILEKQNFKDGVQRIALEHHERIDGSGYPQKLRNDQISKYAKLVAIVDVYDALTTDRCYNKAMNSKGAVNYMSKLSGQFDPDIFKKFADLIDREVIGK